MIRIGQRLREERQHRELTIDEVARATKIRSSFLTAIEKGDYSKLPSSAYIEGFVKNYADFLGLPKKESVALLRREFPQRESLDVLPQGFSQTNRLPFRRIRFGPALIGLLILVLGLGSFLLFQYRYSFISPPLNLTSPHEGQIVEKNVTVTGNTDVNATVTVNDSPVTVQSNGTFEKSVTLFPGKSTIRIKAQNRFGKLSQVERQVEVKE